MILPIFKNPLRSIALWIVVNIPCGKLAPVLLGFAIGSKPRKIARNNRSSGSLNQRMEVKMLNKCNGSQCGAANIMEKRCGNLDEKSGYVCTLPKGHRGAHIACTFGRHNLYHWPNENDEEPKAEGVTCEAK